MHRVSGPDLLEELEFIGAEDSREGRRRTLRFAASSGLRGGAEAHEAAAEGDRTGGEPGPSERKAAEYVGQPVNVEQDAA